MNFFGGFMFNYCTIKLKPSINLFKMSNQNSDQNEQLIIFRKYIRQYITQKPTS